MFQRLQSFYECLLGLNIMIWCKSHLSIFSIIHCDANCFNPAVSAGLCCIRVFQNKGLKIFTICSNTVVGQCGLTIPACSRFTSGQKWKSR